jgi:hypothetical protein
MTPDNTITEITATAPDMPEVRPAVTPNEEVTQPEAPDVAPIPNEEVTQPSGAADGENDDSDEAEEIEEVKAAA